MKILYFAWLAERLGCPEETLQITPENGEALREYLLQRYPEQAEIFADPYSLRMAVNHQLVDWSHPLHAQDEVALFPPMTGG